MFAWPTPDRDLRDRLREMATPFGSERHVMWTEASSPAAAMTAWAKW
jgi:hypothetical protein